MKQFLLLAALLSSVYANAQSCSDFIKIDQLGYLPQDRKIAFVAAPQVGYNANRPYTPGTGDNMFQVRLQGNEKAVFTGTLRAWNNGQTQAQSGDKVWYFDFSDLRTPGIYYVIDRFTLERSCEFKIHPDVYRGQLLSAMRMFYFQRCGQAKMEANTWDKRWVDLACHLNDLQDKDCRLITNPSASSAKDLSGGWHDAGDYNKYVSFTWGALIDLLLAYEEYPEVWHDAFNLPESGNGLPDLLDEAKVELDWLLKMQESDGSVLSLVGVKDFASATPPSADLAQRFYGPATTNASLTLAGVFALAAIQYEAAQEVDYANLLREKAEKSWEWAVTHPQVKFFNSGILAAGEQEGADESVFQKKICAAIFLYASTGKKQYQDFAIANIPKMHLVQWGFAYPFETAEQDALLYYTKIPSADATVKNNILNAYTNSIRNQNLDNLPAYLNQTDAYLAHLSDNNSVTGSNNTRMHQGLMFANMTRYQLDTPHETDYMYASAQYLHYLHGANPTGYCYTTLGDDIDKPVRQLYHAWFGDGSPLDNSPAPGFVVAGPSNQYALDACCPNNCGSTANNAMCSISAVTPPLGQPIQKMYRDFNAGWPQNSWTVSECGIYYQASYLRLLSKFASNGPLSPYASVLETPVTISATPNPFLYTTQITVRSPMVESISLNLYNTTGMLVTSANGETNTPIEIGDALPPGVYGVQARGASGFVAVAVLVKTK